MPAGHLVRFIGPRILLGGALIGCGAITLSIPFIATNFHWTWMCGLRVAQGLCQVIYNIDLQIYKLNSPNKVNKHLVKYIKSVSFNNCYQILSF